MSTLHAALAEARNSIQRQYEASDYTESVSLGDVVTLLDSLLAAHPAPEAGEVQQGHSGFRAICDCGHRVTWHHDRGCGYHGFSEQNCCACQLTSDAAVESILAARLAEVAQPAGETRVEWGVKCDHDASADRRLSERAARAEVAHPPNQSCHPRVVSRTVTSFPDVVGKWEEVAGNE